MKKTNIGIIFPVKKYIDLCRLDVRIKIDKNWLEHQLDFIEKKFFKKGTFLFSKKEYILSTKGRSSVLFRCQFCGLQKLFDYTSGFSIQLFGDTVPWKTQKQTYVALSTCEAEYVAMGHACKEMMPLNNSLKLILDTPFEPIKLWCDNKAVIACSKSGRWKKIMIIKQ